MTPFEEVMAAPRIEVIDAAIARIENGQEVYTCLALREAVGIVFDAEQAPLRSPRIAALKNFRQLCLDAAK